MNIYGKVEGMEIYMQTSQPCVITQDIQTQVEWTKQAPEWIKVTPSTPKVATTLRPLNEVEVIYRE